MKYNPEKKGYRLHSHAQNLTAEGVEFKVSQSGRNKVIQEKQKNVHAFVYCKNYITFVKPVPVGEEIIYNPYKMETFRIKNSDRPIHGASSIVMTGNKCYLNYEKN
jgi:hypothetical protein